MRRVSTVLSNFSIHFLEFLNPAAFHLGSVINGRDWELEEIREKIVFVKSIANISISAGIKGVDTLRWIISIRFSNDS